MGVDKDSAKLATAHLLSAFFVFLAITVFARKLGPYQMGIFFLFQTSLGLLSLAADFGLNQSVNKRLSEGRDPGDIISSGLVVKGALIFIISIFILVFSDFINTYIGGDYANLLIIGLILQQASEFLMAILRGEQRVGATATPKVIKQLVFFAGGWTLIYVGLAADGLVYGLLFGTALMGLLGIIRANIQIRLPEKNHIKSLTNYSQYAAIFSVGGLLNNWMDVAVIGFFMSQNYVGIYETTWRVAGLMSLVSVSIGLTIFPKISEWFSSDRHELIEKQLPQSAARALFFVIPAFFAFLIIGGDILTVLFGTEFGAGWMVLIILGGEKIIDSLQNVYGRALQASNIPSKAARASLASALSNIILNVLLVPLLGIFGAAIATLLATFVNLIVNIFYLREIISVEFPMMAIFYSSISAIGMCLVLVALNQILSISSLGILLVVVLVGVICYFTIAITSNTLRKIMIDVLKDLGVSF